MGHSKLRGLQESRGVAKPGLAGWGALGGLLAALGQWAVAEWVRWEGRCQQQQNQVPVLVPYPRHGP